MDGGNRRIAGADRLSGALLALLGVALGVGALQLDFGTITRPGAGFFPLLLAVLLVGLAGAIFLGSFRRDAEAAPAEFGPRLRELVLTVAALVAYGLLLEPVGYPVLTAVMLALGLRGLARASWPVTLAVSLPATGAIYVLFRGLGVPLPPGLPGL